MSNGDNGGDGDSDNDGESYVMRGFDSRTEHMVHVCGRMKCSSIHTQCSPIHPPIYLPTYSPTYLPIYLITTYSPVNDSTQREPTSMHITSRKHIKHWQNTSTLYLTCLLWVYVHSPINSHRKGLNNARTRDAATNTSNSVTNRDVPQNFLHFFLEAVVNNAAISIHRHTPIQEIAVKWMNMYSM